MAWQTQQLVEKKIRVETGRGRLFEDSKQFFAVQIIEVPADYIKLFVEHKRHGYRESVSAATQDECQVVECAPPACSPAVSKYLPVKPHCVGRFGVEFYGVVAVVKRFRDFRIGIHFLIHLPAVGAPIGVKTNQYLLRLGIKRI